MLKLSVKLQRDFDFKEFERINEELKEIFTSWQTKNDLDMIKFRQLHEVLIGMLMSRIEYEDMVLKLQYAFEQICLKDMRFLVSHPESYHTCIWKLHQRIVYLTKNSEEAFTKEMNDFKSFLDVKFCKFFRTNEGFSAHLSLGSAIGHLIVVNVGKTFIDLDVSDHSFSRIFVFRERLKKFGYLVGEIRKLPIWVEDEGQMSYLLIAKKENKDPGDLQKLADEINSQKDTDWFLHDQLDACEEEEQAEINFLRFAYYLKDKYGIPVTRSIDVLMSILQLNEKNL